jgi:hypothetical protein
MRPGDARERSRSAAEGKAALTARIDRNVDFIPAVDPGDDRRGALDPWMRLGQTGVVPRGNGASEGSAEGARR